MNIINIWILLEPLTYVTILLVYVCGETGCTGVCVWCDRLHWCMCVVWQVALVYVCGVTGCTIMLWLYVLAMDGPHPLKWLLSAIYSCVLLVHVCAGDSILTWQSHDCHVSLFPPFPLLDSRILIGSLSRHNLKAMLDDHMKGVHKHAQQIRDQSQLYVRHYQLVMNW